LFKKIWLDEKRAAQLMDGFGESNLEFLILDFCFLNTLHLKNPKSKIKNF